MIVSSGYNISGFEVEAALLEHPAVAECAVVAAPDEERGHVVKAYRGRRGAPVTARRSCRTTSRRGSRRTSTRARSSSSTRCRARRPARSSGTCCASASHEAPPAARLAAAARLRERHRRPRAARLRRRADRLGRERRVPRTPTSAGRCARRCATCVAVLAEAGARPRARRAADLVRHRPRGVPRRARARSAPPTATSWAATSRRWPWSRCPGCWRPRRRSRSRPPRSCAGTVRPDRFGSPRKGVFVHTRYVLAVASVLTLALPAAAQAATKTVYMGAPPKDQKKFNQPYGTDVVDFFPGNVTIVAGDSVKFDLVAFHNVDIPPKGGKMIEQLVQKGPATNVFDAAGNKFWYSDTGAPNFAFAPELQNENNGLGHKYTYTGAKRIISHIPLNTAHPFQPFKPMTVKFPKAGSITYFCDLHPGHAGHGHGAQEGQEGADRRSGLQDAQEAGRRRAEGRQDAQQGERAGEHDVRRLRRRPRQGRVLQLPAELADRPGRDDRDVQDEPGLARDRTRPRRAPATTWSTRRRTSARSPTRSTCRSSIRAASIRASRSARSASSRRRSTATGSGTPGRWTTSPPRCRRIRPR